MKFNQQLPSTHFKHIIAYFWTLQATDNERDNVYRFIPDGYVDWIFHLGTPWQCHFPNVVSSSSTAKFHVFGQIKRHVDLCLPFDKLNLFGVKFNPWVVKKIWNIDMHYLTNSCVDIEALGLTEIEVMQDKILNALDFNERISIIETYLLPYVNIEEDIGLKNAFSFFFNNEMKGNNIKSTFGVRRLEQRFKNELGISPKLFYSTHRINNVISQLKASNPKTLTQIALENNYYDQSHFIRDFKQFTGLRPSCFLKSISPDGDILNLRVN